MSAERDALAEQRAVQVREVLSLIEGGASEKAACEQVGIPRSTFRQAAIRYGDASYARACEALAQDQVEKIEAVIEDLRDGTITPEVARVELDARKWTASRLFRKTWGDRTEITGKDGGPIEHRNLSEEEVDARLAALLGTGGGAKEPSA